MPRASTLGKIEKEIEKLSSDHGDFRGVNTIRAKDGTASTFGALIKIIKPFFNDRGS